MKACLSLTATRPSVSLRGLIFDIQGHSVHDGPGTRTTIFLCGCPLNCVWCSNPEGLFHHQVMMHRNSRCKLCGTCVRSCPHRAVRILDGKVSFDRGICDTCSTFECAKTCYYESQVISGKYYTIDDIMRILQRDRQFWGARGGVTLSGGEPLLQKNFSKALLMACKESFIHTCIETTSCIREDAYLDSMQYVDWAFTDIKHMDSGCHKELTGVGNELILGNIRTLAQSDWDGVLVPRVPVIPGRNDSDGNISATAEFIRDIGLDVINLLPFHRLGESKYRQLGKTYIMENQTPPTDEHMQHLKKIVESKGILCFIGWETPF